MAKRNLVHFELPTGNTEESKNFYGKMFGWEFETDDTYHYTMISTGNVTGGFSPLRDESNPPVIKPGDVLVYVHSDDVEADLKQIESLGGKAVGERMDMPGIGSIAMFMDPTGNVLALFKAEQQG